MYGGKEVLKSLRSNLHMGHHEGGKRKGTLKREIGVGKEMLNWY